jgi:hypothetical protein
VDTAVSLAIKLTRRRDSSRDEMARRINSSRDETQQSINSSRDETSAQVGPMIPAPAPGASAPPVVPAPPVSYEDDGLFGLPEAPLEDPSAELDRRLARWLPEGDGVSPSHTD